MAGGSEPHGSDSADFRGAVPEMLDLVAVYLRKSEDPSLELSPTLRPAYRLLAEARQKLYEDRAAEALEQAQEALETFCAVGHQEGVADGLSLVAQALIQCDQRKEANRRVVEQLQRFRKSGDQEGEAKMLLSFAEINAVQRGSKKREEAQDAASEVLARFRQWGDWRNEADTLLILSCLHTKKKSSDKTKKAAEALALSCQARAICSEKGYKRGEAACLHAMASAHELAGDYEQCMEVADEALDLYLELQDAHAEAFELMCMAQWSLKHGRPGKATSDAEDALHILRSVSSPRDSRALAILVQGHRARGDKQSAVSVVVDSLKFYREAGNSVAEADALDMLIDSYCDHQHFEEALHAATQASQIFSHLGNHASEARMMALIAQLHLRSKRPEEALQLGKSNLERIKKHGTSREKADVMLTLAQSYLELNDASEALEICEHMGALFTSECEVRGQAEACVAVSSLHLLQQNYSEAVTAALKAQSLLSEEGDSSGEARTLRLLAEIHSKKEEHKAAIRAAERARALFRSQQDSLPEASCLFLVAQESVLLAVKEGVRVAGGTTNSRSSREALDKAATSAEAAARLCRTKCSGEDEAQVREVLGSSLCCSAQVHMLCSRPEMALEVADEAVHCFRREVGLQRHEGSALLLRADALRVLNHHLDSRAAAQAALRLFQNCTPPDVRGQGTAEKVLDFLKQFLQPVPQLLQQQQQMSTIKFAQDSNVGASGTTRASRDRGPALDLAGLSVELLRKKIAELTASIVGLEGDEEIEADSPLLEAGLTSTTAVSLRDELAKDLPGINLPVTLVFDYPSISMMADLILESSAGGDDAEAGNAAKRPRVVLVKAQAARAPSRDRSAEAPEPRGRLRPGRAGGTAGRILGWLRDAGRPESENRRPPAKPKAVVTALASAAVASAGRKPPPATVKRPQAVVGRLSAAPAK
ncbi:unnamed protein product, partial [Polarella glacialis]